MRLFIIGIGGFIGASLTKRLLQTVPDIKLSGLDLSLARLGALQGDRRLTLQKASMAEAKPWVEAQVQQADVVMPLAAIADPSLYVKDPIQVFELDFEANLEIVRLCVKHKKRLIFPSTSEVYGMATDAAFDEDKTHLIQGPIQKDRWIYSASKQLLDRVIHAYGWQQGLDFTLFRPFNWIGPLLDHLDLENGGRGRVLVQMLGNLLRGQDIILTGDGSQSRCFTDIEDALDALVAILDRPLPAKGQIFNIGNPQNDVSIKIFAETLKEVTLAHPLCPAVAQNVRLVTQPSSKIFGDGYQDISKRVPSIEKAKKLLGWAPRLSLKESLTCIVDVHLRRFFGKHSA